MSGVLLLAAEGSRVLPGGWTLIIIGAAAFFLPLIARRVGLPAVVLEILFGLAIGPEVLNVVARGTSDFEFIEFLAELGLLLLMFLAGFEIDFERLERQGPGPILFGLMMFGFFVAAMWFGFGLLDLESTNQRIFLTLLTAAASLGIVIPALRGTGRSATPLGQITIVVAVLAEFLSAAGIVIFGVWVLNEGLGWGLLRVPGLFAIVAVILVIVRRMAWWFPERFERLFTTQDPDELGIRASLALLLVFVGISVVLNIEPILGAFLAGAAFAFVFRNSGDLETRLGGFAYGFFIPVFFISVGVRFPLSVLQDSSVLTKAFLLIAIAIAGKLVTSIVLQLRGFTFKESLASGVLLAGQLSVIIALAEFGRNDLGVIDEGLEAGAILLVGVTAVFSPILFRVMLPPLGTPAEDAAAVPDHLNQ